MNPPPAIAEFATFSPRTSEPKRVPQYDALNVDLLATKQGLITLLKVPPDSPMPLPFHYREAFHEILVCGEGERVAEEIRQELRAFIVHAYLSLNTFVDSLVPKIMKKLGIDPSLLETMRRYMFWKIQDPAFIHVTMHGYPRWNPKKQMEAGSFTEKMRGTERYRYPETLIEEPTQTYQPKAA